MQHIKKIFCLCAMYIKCMMCCIKQPLNIHVLKQKCYPIKTLVIYGIQALRIPYDKILLFISMILCIFTLFFHLLFSFEDIGMTLQGIVDKAKNSALLPIVENNQLSTLQRSMFEKLDFKMTKEQIELGKILFFDPRLSGDSLHSCNSCHNLALYGTSFVDEGQLNPQKLNAPTLYNMIFNDVAYYQGKFSRFDTDDKNTTKFPTKNIIARATLHALTASNEMNGNIEKVIALISKSDEYMSYFKRAYGTKVKVSGELIAQSIAGFIMTLHTFSRYDDFLTGNLKALSFEEAKGLELFIDKGCVACHNGINLGGSMQPFEVMRPYKFANIGGLSSNADKMIKVPTLRNITMTAPYFHNGGFQKLEDAIQEMGQIQLGITLSNKEIAGIISFLETLRGYPEPVSIPILPRL